MYLVEFRNDQVLTVILILSKLVCDLQTSITLQILFSSLSRICVYLRFLDNSDGLTSDFLPVTVGFLWVMDETSIYRAIDGFTCDILYCKK